MASCKSGASHRKKGGHVTPKRELQSDGSSGLVFTQVNVHDISRLNQLVKMFVVGTDDWILRQSASGADDVNALKPKNFP